MKLWQITNKANSSQIIAAKNADRALEIALKAGRIRAIKNAKVKDITTDYIKHHSPRGFNIASISEGLFYQVIQSTPITSLSSLLNNKSTYSWETHMP